MLMKPTNRMTEAASYIRTQAELVAQELEGRTLERPSFSYVDGVYTKTSETSQWVDPANVIDELRGLERQLELTRRAVAEHMRAGGSSWAQIGEALGVTKQAAQQRYSL